MELARHISDRDLNTIFKLVLKIGSPHMLLRRGPSLWARYYDTGIVESEQLAPHQWQMTLDAPTDPEEAANRFICAQGVCGWVEHGLELTGVTGTCQHVECRFQGADRCRYDVRW